MSRENVEAVRRSYEAWIAGREDAARPTWSDDCEWHDPPDFPDASVYRGPDAVARHLDELWGALGVVEVGGFQFDDLIPVGEDEVVVLASIQTRGASSGVPLEIAVDQVVQVRDGKVRRWRTFSSPGAALQAVGLRA